MNEPGFLPALRWFPLIGWARFPCLPLPERVAELAAVLREPTADPAPAAAEVMNRASLLASDCGLPGLARDLCWQHINAYRRRPRPLSAADAQRMLGPAMNLARLDLRAGETSEALLLLDRIYVAVATRADLTIDGQILPIAGITGSRDERYRLREAVWRQTITDGVRAHAMNGDWNLAAKLAEDRKGVGYHLMEGRQATIIARLLAGDQPEASRILAETTISEPWEEQVAACMAIFCNLATEVRPAIHKAAGKFLSTKTSRERIVFRTRLGLAIAFLARQQLPKVSAEILVRITARAIDAADAYAARDILQAPVGPVSLEKRQALDVFIGSSGLGRGEIPPARLASFNDTVEAALRAIGRS